MNMKTILSNWGFSVLLKDTSTCNPEAGIEPGALRNDHYSRPRYVMFPVLGGELLHVSCMKVAFHPLPTPAPDPFHRCVHLAQWLPVLALNGIEYNCEVQTRPVWVQFIGLLACQNFKNKTQAVLWSICFITFHRSLPKHRTTHVIFKPPSLNEVEERASLIYLRWHQRCLSHWGGCCCCCAPTLAQHFPDRLLLWFPGIS